MNDDKNDRIDNKMKNNMNKNMNNMLSNMANLNMKPNIDISAYKNNKSLHRHRVIDRLNLIEHRPAMSKTPTSQQQQQQQQQDVEEEGNHPAEFSASDRLNLVEDIPDMSEKDALSALQQMAYFHCKSPGVFPSFMERKFTLYGMMFLHMWRWSGLRSVPTLQEPCLICSRSVNILIRHKSCRQCICQTCLLDWTDHREGQRRDVTCPMCRGLIREFGRDYSVEPSDDDFDCEIEYDSDWDMI